MARPRQPSEAGLVLDLVLGPIDLNLLGLHVRADCQDDPVPVLAEGLPGALLGDTLHARSTREVQAALTQQIETRSQVRVTPSEPA